MSRPTLKNAKDAHWTAFEWHLKRGEKDYARGRPKPPMPRVSRSLKAAYWYGYMLARGKVLMERMRVRDALRPDPDEPRPRKAA